MTAARLAFIVIFQNFVGFVQLFADWIVPDVPELIKARIRREEQLINEFIIKRETAKVTNFRRRRRKKDWPDVSLNVESEQ